MSQIIIRETTNASISIPYTHRYRSPDDILSIDIHNCASTPSTYMESTIRHVSFRDRDLTQRDVNVFFTRMIEYKVQVKDISLSFMSLNKENSLLFSIWAKGCPDLEIMSIYNIFDKNDDLVYFFTCMKGVTIKNFCWFPVMKVSFDVLDAVYEFVKNSTIIGISSSCDGLGSNINGLVIHNIVRLGGDKFSVESVNDKTGTMTYLAQSILSTGTNNLKTLSFIGYTAADGEWELLLDSLSRTSTKIEHFVFQGTGPTSRKDMTKYNDLETFIGISKLKTFVVLNIRLDDVEIVKLLSVLVEKCADTLESLELDFKEVHALTLVRSLKWFISRTRVKKIHITHPDIKVSETDELDKCIRVYPSKRVPVPYELI